MKKLLAIAGIAATCVALADDTVTGTTEVGILSITSTAVNTIVAVPYLEMTGGNICVSNIVKTANLAAGDELYVYDGSWTAWVLQEGTSGAKYWQSVGTATIGSDGKPTLGVSGEASDETIVPGGAIWLTRKNPSSTPFYVYGQYTSGQTTTVAANARTLVANPTASPVSLTGKIANPAAGDSIYFLNDSGTGWTWYVYSNSKGWCLRDEDNKTSTAATVPNLASGCGVWVKLKNGATIQW